MKQIIIFCIAIVVAFAFQNCGNNNSNGEEEVLDQTAFLNNIGDNLIVKGYDDFLAKASALNTAAGTFVASPSLVNLEELRNEWFNASQSWQKVAFYNFGPAETNAILTINFYPTDTSLIKSNINSGTYDLNMAGSTFAKGFPAIDYLIYGYADSDQEIVDKFIGNQNARDYLTDLTSNIETLAQAVSDNWDSYITTFKSNKGTSKGSSLSLLVNAWSQYMEVHVRNGKIGIPNGNNVVSSERLGPFPEKTESHYSLRSLEMLKTANTAIMDFYLGKAIDNTDGVGIYDLLIELNAQNGTLANDYKQLFEDVSAQLNAINGSLEETIEADGEDVTAVFNNYKALVALLKVDIVSALSISITYADNDGD